MEGDVDSSYPMVLHQVPQMDNREVLAHCSNVSMGQLPVSMADVIAKDPS